MNPVLPLEFLVPLLAVGLAAVALSGWRGTRGCRPAARVGLLTLRVAAWLILSVVALNPGQWRVTGKTGASEWAILVDGSASMETADVEGETRWARSLTLARRALRTEAGPRARLFVFDSELRAGPMDGDALRGLVPDGQGTALNRAGGMLLDLYEGRSADLEAVMVLSDGRQTDTDRGQSWALRALARAIPIHVYPLGGAVERRDLTLTVPRRQYVRFPGQTLRVRARIASGGLPALRATVRLLSADGVALSERKVDLPANGSRDVLFDTPESERAYETYTLAVDAWPEENDPHNNSAGIGVRKLDREIHALLLEGEPHWDSKFLAQLLRRQPHVRVTSVHRVTGERFFRVTSEDEEARRVETVFPQTREALGDYDVVILGKGAEYFLDERAVARLETYVRRDGGTILFARGKSYQGIFPSLARLEPVAWGDVGAAGGPWQWRPVADVGAGLFGDALPGHEDPVWNRLSPVAGSMHCRRLMPFAVVLAEGVPESGVEGRAQPLVIARRLGSGMTLAVNAENLWTWDFFPRFEEAGDLYKRLWIETVQWMTTRSGFLPGHGMAVTLGASQTQPGDPVKILVDFRGVKPVEAPALAVVTPDGERMALQPRRTHGGAERFEAVFVPGAAGDHRVEVQADEDRAEAILHVMAPPGELDERSADPDALRALAELSGGLVLDADTWPAAMAQLAGDKLGAVGGIEIWHAAWDRVWILAVLVLVLLAEWVIRRRRGLL